MAESRAGVRLWAAMTVEQLAQALGAELLAPPLGGPEADAAKLAEAALAQAVHRNRLVEGVGSVGRADGSTLVFVEDESALEGALQSAAGAIVLPPNLVAGLPAGGEEGGAALLVAAQPRLAFARAAVLLRRAEPGRGVHATAFVAPGAVVGHRVSIGAYAVVEQGAVLGAGTEIGAGAVMGAGVVVGAECRIYPRVVVYPGTTLGDRVVVHAGAVLGSDGFGYVRDMATGAYVQFPQQGTLVIEDDVEIGANTTIDRGALEETRIGRGAKLDNLVHVGHNCRVGEDVVIAAQTGISGSSVIGRGAVIAGQVGIGDHAGVGEGVILGGQAGVLPHKTLRGAGELFWGTPAKPVKQYLRELGTLAKMARGRRGGESE